MRALRYPSTLANLMSVARAHNVDGFWDWDDATTPKTDKPVRFGWQWGTVLFPRASWTTRS